MLVIIGMCNDCAISRIWIEFFICQNTGCVVQLRHLNESQDTSLWYIYIQIGLCLLKKQITNT